ncbi:hypothetical protein KRR39_04115 [Nocardioides panacis]|uniref:Uncharacterized protein n=1 Tax=Nocardioides panacis TaxID=2849501 RepID=A0A975Y106_9ACTN|nr:hypothetical protein [Nocardioides panacis]QWZ09021.1 hypothetical protein KRR39_04115 [Nocardioides panacis]
MAAGLALVAMLRARCKGAYWYFMKARIRSSADPVKGGVQYRQQYLAKNPKGYQCHSTTGVPFPEDV